VWNNDATTVLLQAQGDLPIGSYILKVSGIDIGADTFQVEVKPLTLTSVYIPTAYISPNNAAARIMITGKDQYGQDYNVASSDFIWIINDTVSNINLQPTTSSNSYLTVQTNLSAIRAGDKISVYCMGKTNILLTATTTLEVNTKPINNIVLVQPILPAGDKRLIVKTVDTYYEIPYEAVQDYTLNGVTTHASALLDDRAEAPLAQTVTLNNFIFSTDRSDVITSIKVEGGRLFIKLAANASGTVKLNATQQPDVGQSTTQNINTLTLNIAGPAMPDSFTYTDTKAVLVTGGSINKLPITVYDQYGEVVTPDAFARSNFSDFTILSSNTGIATAAFGIDGKTLNITPVGVGQANITIVNRNSGKTILYTATVNPASIVKDFVSTVDYTTITKGASANLKIDTLDQYGNKLSSAGGTYKYLITAVNGSTNVKISTTSAGISIIASSVITLTGMTAGRTEAITVNLYNDGNNNNKIDANELIKTNAFYINIVADNEPLVYTVNPTNTVYAAVSQDGSNSGLTEDAYGAVQNQNNKNLNYAVKLTMSATKNDGTPVALASNPIKSVNATVNQGIIDFMGKSGNDFVIVGKQWSASELTKDAILQIYFVDNSGAIRTINAKVTVSKESLKATKLRFMANVGRDNDETSDTEVLSSVVNITAADFYNLDGKKIIENQSLTGVSNYFEVDDQYGVSSFNPVNVSIIGKQTANGVFTMDSSGIIKTNGFLYGDSITLSATDTEGHNLIITLKLQ
jgi:hypothetical protein